MFLIIYSLTCWSISRPGFSFSILFLFGLELIDKALEHRTLSVEKIVWFSVLLEASVVKHTNSVGVDNRIQSVGNREDGGVLELVLDELHDLLLWDNVDVGSGLVKDDDLSLTQGSTADANKLLLTGGQVITTFFDFEVSQANFLIVLENLSQTWALQEIVNLFVAVIFFWVDVESEGTSEESWVLRNSGNLLSQVLKLDLLDIDTVNPDGSSLDLKDSQQSETKSRFTSTGSTNNTDLETVIDIEVQSLKNLIESWSVPELDALQGNLALLWPIFFWYSALFDLLNSVLEVN